MKKIFRAFLLVLWTLAGTILLGRWWHANPDYFPHFPDSFWRYLDKIFGVENVDDAQIVELFVITAVSLFVIATITTIIIAIAGYVKQRRDA
jgi:hypothetical protein